MAGQPNSAYIGLGYFQRGLPWPGLWPIGGPTDGLARWEHWIYELLVGAKLFVSQVEVYRYYFGIRAFPEDRLKGLSPPTDDLGIGFLKSMLVIQPEDRPTAASAQSHCWLDGLKSDNADSGAGQDEVTQDRMRAFGRGTN